MQPISNFKTRRPRGVVQLDLSNFLICPVSSKDLPILSEIVFGIFQPRWDSHANEATIFSGHSES